MIEQGIGFYFSFILVMLIILVASISIPFYGYIWKRWKGVALGCLLQPIVCVIICVLAVTCISLFQIHSLRKYREAAMVTVSKEDTCNNVHFWYLKADEECYYEYKEKANAENEYTGFDRARLFDVVKLDSSSVVVDDKIVVRFDMKNHKATATEYEEPMEVVNVDWDKVKDYFGKHP